MKYRLTTFTKNGIPYKWEVEPTCDPEDFDRMGLFERMIEQFYKLEKYVEETCE